MWGKREDTMGEGKKEGRKKKGVERIGGRRKRQLIKVVEI